MSVCQSCEAVVDQLTARHQIDQVGHHFGRGTVDLQKGEEAETERKEKSPNWDTAFCALREESRCVAFDRHSMQGTSRRKKKTISGAKDGRHDQGVDKVRKTVDFEPLHGNDIWSKCD